MDFYTKLARRPRLFLLVTGMHLHTFQELLPQFEQAFLTLEAERKCKTVRPASDRQRAAGAGHAFNAAIDMRRPKLFGFESRQSPHIRLTSEQSDSK